jgi:hypothetical protein
VLGGGGMAEPDSAVLGGGGMAEPDSAVLGGGGMTDPDSAVLGGGGMTGPDRAVLTGGQPGRSLIATGTSSNSIYPMLRLSGLFRNCRER